MDYVDVDVGRRIFSANMSLTETAAIAAPQCANTTVPFECRSDLPEATNTFAPSQPPTAGRAPPMHTGGVIVTAFALSVVTSRASALSVGSLLVAFQAGIVGHRVAACVRDENDVIDSIVGASLPDNPTQLSLPGEAAKTGGAVVGNTLMIYCAPVVGAAASVAWRLWRQKGRAHPATFVAVYVSGLLNMESVLQLPTGAASVALLISCRSVVALLIGSVGLLFVLVPLCAVALAIVRQHPIQGHPIRQRPLSRGAALTSRVVRWWTSPRSSWRVRVATKRDSNAVMLLATVLAQLLEGCQYPHSWVVLWDAANTMVQGVLSGVASSARECSVIEGASWCLFGVSALSFVVSVAVRPRATAGDCITDVCMNLWTSVMLLLSALGIEDSSGWSVTAQTLVQIALTLPCLCWRAWSRQSQNHKESIQSTTRRRTALASSTSHTRKSSRFSSSGPSPGAQLCTQLLSVKEPLDVLIRMACVQPAPASVLSIHGVRTAAAVQR